MSYNNKIKDVYSSKSIEEVCLSVRYAMLQEAEDMKDNFMEQFLVERLKFYAELLNIK